MHKVIAFKKN